MSKRILYFAVILTVILLRAAVGMETQPTSAVFTGSTCSAATETSSAHTTGPLNTDTAIPLKSEFNVWRSIGSMIIVLGVLLALTWFLKNRVNGGAGIGGQRRMQIVEKVSLGQRQCLALIRIDNEEMLVGISPDRIDELGFTRNARIEKASTDGVAMTAANTETGEM